MNDGVEEQLVKWLNVRHCRVALEQIKAIDPATMHYRPYSLHLELIQELQKNYELALRDYEKGEPN